jgi:hypothetical protein
MLAWEIARTWWQDHSPVPFEERLGWHLSCGLVYSTASAFMLASEERWDPEQKAIVDGRESRVESQQPNAWFVELAVAAQVEGRGSRVEGQNTIREFLRVAPHPHEWVLFRRNNGFRIHAYRWSHLARRVGHPR